MKRYAWLCASLVLLSAACRSGSADTNVRAVPKPGAVVAADSTDALNNKLNRFHYVVTVVADSNVAYGIYNVIAEYGPNMANGQFTMPHGAAQDVPLLRRGKDAGIFIVGFRHGEDTAFYEYYEVRFSRVMGENASNNIAMRYLKGYSFQ